MGCPLITFSHYNLMGIIMPKAVKGKHTFCASQQSHEATSSRPALSSREKGTWKVKRKGKGKEQEPAMRIDLELGNNSGVNNNSNENTIFLSLLPVPTSAIPLSTSTSVLAVSSGKRKYSALDDNISMLSVLSKNHSSIFTIENVSAGIMAISCTIDGLTAEHKRY